MAFSKNQRALMVKLARQKGVRLVVWVNRYRPYTREFGSGCSIFIREHDPDTGEKWDSHYMSNSKDRPLAIERAKKIAQFLVEAGAADVKISAVKEKRRG